MIKSYALIVPITPTFPPLSFPSTPVHINKFFVATKGEKRKLLKDYDITNSFSQETPGSKHPSKVWSL